MEFFAGLPDWAISGVFAAVAGTIAGLIGWGLAKRGFTWARFLPVVAVVVTIAALNGGVSAWIKRSTVTLDYADGQLMAVNPRLYGFMKEAFPDDYAMLTRKVVDLTRSNTPSSELGPMAAETMAELRRKYAPLIGLASDAEHAAIIEASVEFYEALFARDPALCNEVAVAGPTALLNRPGTEGLIAMVEPQTTLLLQAAVSGRSNPVSRPEATDIDWEDLGSEMMQQGATDAEFNAAFGNDASSPAFCAGLIRMMRAMNSVDYEGIKTVRAEYIKEISAR